MSNRQMTTYHRLAGLEHQGREIRTQFSYLLRAVEVMQYANARSFKTLSMSQNEANDYIEAHYQGITVRFSLFLGYDELERPIGKVMVTYRYEIYAKPSVELIGQFEFDSNGQLNNDFYPDGTARMMVGAPEELVEHFLDLAAKSKRLPK
jgi:hypothetical protein